MCTDKKAFIAEHHDVMVRMLEVYTDWVKEVLHSPDLCDNAKVTFVDATDSIIVPAFDKLSIFIDAMISEMAEDTEVEIRMDHVSRIMNVIDSLEMASETIISGPTIEA